MRVRRTLLWGLLVAVLLGVTAAAFWSGWSRWSGWSGSRAQLPEYGSLPPFELTDQQGRSVGLEDLAGVVWIADFVFTRCVAVCPAMSLKMSALDRQLPPEVRLVSVTVDPTHDTPAVLSDYAERFDASPRWSFLTGEAQAIYDLSLDGFHLAVDPDPPPELASEQMPILHSTRFALVDREGRIRGYYDALSSEDVARLAADARSLLR